MPGSQGKNLLSTVQNRRLACHFWLASELCSIIGPGILEAGRSESRDDAMTEGGERIPPP